MFDKRLLLAAAFACIGLTDGCAAAEDVMKTCNGVDIRVVHVGSEIPKGLQQLDARPRLVVAAPASTPEDQGERVTTITAFGPMLGSMDSGDVNVSVACSATGFALTALITRSEDYNGAVLANILWRPKITLRVVRPRPEMTMDAVWTMRSTSGAQLARARTPPYLELKYPFTVTAMFRS